MDQMWTPGRTERALPQHQSPAEDPREIRHGVCGCALLVVPGHGLFVTRLTGYLTVKLEGYEK